ncbi:unnamed protein product [Spirodela intermedia]|uniref:Uncharacterized protein n=1 Tax=Spirodela intermedia TaxID=51605 RepID=A0A7I8LAM3_SPIIN|nr:unnamed protein product [Spirodela intermedia]
MSSPARSPAPVSATGGGAAGFADEAGAVSSSSCHIPRDFVTPEDRRDEALAVLKADLKAALDREVKTLDRDSWMFAAPRSQIHLIFRPGGSPSKKTSD